MSGLNLRGRAVAVAAFTAIILPFGIAAASSASAAGSPLDVLGSTTGNSIATGPLGTVTGLAGGTGAVTGLLGGAAGNPTSAVTGVLANPTGAAGTATGLVPGTGAVTGLVPGTGAVTGLIPGTGAVTGLIPGTGAVTGLVPTVTGLVPTVTGLVPAVTNTVTGLVPTVTGLVPNLLGGVNTKAPTTGINKQPAKTVKAVKGAHKAEKEVVVATGSLPHTGGDANATALLMCAGLAIAGAGVTLATRRKNGLALHAAR